MKKILLTAIIAITVLASCDKNETQGTHYNLNINVYCEDWDETGMLYITPQGGGESFVAKNITSDLYDLINQHNEIAHEEYVLSLENWSDYAGQKLYDVLEGLKKINIANFTQGNIKSKFKTVLEPGEYYAIVFASDWVAYVTDNNSLMTARQVNSIKIKQFYIQAGQDVSLDFIFEATTYTHPTE